MLLTRLYYILRDHPFQTSANFHDFWPLPPSVGSFLLLSVGKFGQFLTPPSLRNADVLNGWSLKQASTKSLSISNCWIYSNSIIDIHFSTIASEIRNSYHPQLFIFDNYKNIPTGQLKNNSFTRIFGFSVMWQIGT